MQPCKKNRNRIIKIKKLAKLKKQSPHLKIFMLICLLANQNKVKGMEVMETTKLHTNNHCSVKFTCSFLTPNWLIFLPT